MKWDFSDIVVVLLAALFVFGLGVVFGTDWRGEVIEKDAIRNGVGFYSANRETGEVKFYWVGNGTNVEAYVGGK